MGGKKAIPDKEVVNLRNKRSRERYATDPEFRKKKDSCSTAYNKKRYREDPEFRKKHNKNTYESLKKRLSKDPEFKKQLYLDNSIRSKNRYNDNIEQSREQRRKYYQEHKEHVKEYVKSWRIKNPEKYKVYLEKSALAEKERRKDPEYRKKRSQATLKSLKKERK
jgi:hypothetical protein